MYKVFENLFGAYLLSTIIVEIQEIIMFYLNNSFNKSYINYKYFLLINYSKIVIYYLIS